MTPSPLAQPTERLRPRSAPAPREDDRRCLILTSAVVGSLLATVLAGCSGDANGNSVNPPSTATTSPSSTPTAVDEQTALMAQYRTFWASLTSVSRRPAAQRRAALARYTVDPALKSLLAGMAKTDAKGQVYYGADVPRATAASVSPDGLTAVVNDCQDSRNSGVARKSDLAPLTRGVARNHVVVTLKKVTGVWKVYFVSYSKTSC